MRTAQIEKRALPERDGEPLQDPVGIGDALGACWGEVCADPDIGASAAENFLCFAHVWDVAEWSWERGRTSQLAANVGDNSLGRHDISYAFRAGAPPFSHVLLDDMSERAQEGGDLPASPASPSPFRRVTFWMTPS